MRHIAITGGIGSGKSFVCRLLREYGINVYDSDDAAKRLYYDPQLQAALRKLVGDNVYKGNMLQKRVLAEFLLASEENKQAANNIIHPAVARDFMQSGKEWLESAILFDSGFYRRVKFDHVVCVAAPLQLRISRVVQRDGIPREKALEWINRQWPQEEVERRSDFVIINDGEHNLDTQIKQILHQLQIS